VALFRKHKVFGQVSKASLNTIFHRGVVRIMGWTEQQIQMLKEMWGNGYSASEIAGRIGGGLSRNAIIGKAHRLKLSAGLSAAKIGPAAGHRVPAAQNMSANVKSSRKRVMLRPLPVLPVPPSTTVTKIVSKESFRSLDSINGIKRSEGVAVTRAGERQCRWPVGDPRSPDFRFCGCQVYESLPYCIDHARVAYQSMGRKHRSSEAEASSDEQVSQRR
jgi:GcrA cell cycle regulator